jgi:outer membrane protein OmpA-like peptidoglycan-associated protein
VADEDDKCPDEAGPASNAGCPLVDNSDILKINDAAAHILFATGSAKLLPASFAPLDQVAAIMKQHGSYKLDVSGHTDNVGDRAKNKALSVNRVNAVRDYLVSKGIDGSRISAAGYGDEKPVADNKTAAGRAKNRRVEMKVSPY